MCSGLPNVPCGERGPWGAGDPGRPPAGVGAAGDAASPCHAPAGLRAGGEGGAGGKGLNTRGRTGARLWGAQLWGAACPRGPLTHGGRADGPEGSRGCPQVLTAAAGPQSQPSKRPALLCPLWGGPRPGEEWPTRRRGSRRGGREARRRTGRVPPLGAWPRGSGCAREAEAPTVPCVGLGGLISQSGCSRPLRVTTAPAVGTLTVLGRSDRQHRAPETGKPGPSTGLPTCRAGTREPRGQGSCTHGAAPPGAPRKPPLLFLDLSCCSFRVTPRKLQEEPTGSAPSGAHSKPTPSGKPHLTGLTRPHRTTTTPGARTPGPQPPASPVDWAAVTPPPFQSLDQTACGSQSRPLFAVMMISHEQKADFGVTSSGCTPFVNAQKMTSPEPLSPSRGQRR